jgi:hypothetical protein
MEDSSLRCRRIGAPLVIPPGQGDYFVWQQGYRGGTHVSLFPFVDLNGLSGAATGAIFLLHPGEVVELVAGGVTYFVAGRKPSSTELPLRTTQRFDLDAPPRMPTAGAARRQA